MKTLKPGEMTPVIATDRGAYLILAEDKREGDLSFDQVKTELAWEMAKDVWAKEAAKRAALSALNGAKGAQLDEGSIRRMHRRAAAWISSSCSTTRTSPRSRRRSCARC